LSAAVDALMPRSIGPLTCSNLIFSTLPVEIRGHRHGRPHRSLPSRGDSGSGLKLLLLGSDPGTFDHVVGLMRRMGVLHRLRRLQVRVLSSRHPKGTAA